MTNFFNVIVIIKEIAQFAVTSLIIGHFHPGKNCFLIGLEGEFPNVLDPPILTYNVLDPPILTYNVLDPPILTYNVLDPPF